MGRILKYWPKEEIIKALQALPKDKPINKKSIMEYHKQGLMCNGSVIPHKFGTLKNACDEAGVRCDALYGKEHQAHMSRLNIKYTKENLIELLQKNNKRYFKKLTPTNIILKINKDNGIDIRGACAKHFGSCTKALDEANIPYKSYHWSKPRIIEQLQMLYKKYGPFNKAKIHKFQSEGLLCTPHNIRCKFGSIDNLGKEAGIIFGKPVSKIRKIYTGRLGYNEKKILDIIERKHKIRLERQFFIRGKHIDGYDTKNAIAYEVDERRHKHNYQQIKDK